MTSTLRTPKEALEALGVTLYTPRRCAAPTEAAGPVSASLADLKQQVAACTQCRLHTTRSNTVFGVGSETAEVMVIGEAPGYHEDKQGEPFVGKAGQLLNAMLASIQLARESVFIANVLKCRPPNNRDPLHSEVAMCTGFLNQQIALIKPKLLLAVGRVAAQYLLQTDLSLARMRGQQHHFGEANTPLFVTYHPAYLLRNPGDKRKAYEDLLRVREWLNTYSSSST